MIKRFLNIIILTLVIVIWTYWSLMQEYSKTTIPLNYKLHFEHLLRPNKLICSNGAIHLIIIVTSYVGHVELRSAHRRAMPSNYLKSKNTSRIFLLAKIPTNEKYITQEAINDENNIFGDILQGSFYENYRNLTYKHIMGLKWASSVCNKAYFILKIDDDTVFNIERTLQLLSNINYLHQQDFLMGYMLNNTKPRRNKLNKWYVTWDEYHNSVYPSYLSGWYYITTPSVAAKLSAEAENHAYFWIDDIYVTGVLTEALRIRLLQLPEKYWLEYYELVECCLKDMILKSVMCEYVVGPNGGRNNLIVEFNEAIKHCDIWKNCTERPDDQALNKVCVAYRQRTIFSNGMATVQYARL